MFLLTFVGSDTIDGRATIQFGSIVAQPGLRARGQTVVNEDDAGRKILDDHGRSILPPGVESLPAMRPAGVGRASHEEVAVLDALLER